MPTHLLLADDHQLIRHGLRLLVEQAGMVVMGEASDGPEALRLAHIHAPAVAILDIAMPHVNGVETARRLRETLPQLKSILLTMHTEEAYVLERLAFACMVWTLAFFAVLHWLTQKALQDRQVIGQLYRLLTDGLHEGARVLVAMMTHHIGQRTQAFLG